MKNKSLKAELLVLSALCSHTEFSAWCRCKSHSGNFFTASGREAKNTPVVKVLDTTIPKCNATVFSLTSLPLCSPLVCLPASDLQS